LPKLNKGFILVLEGNEGSGKGEQTKLLKQRIEREFLGQKVITTAEPWESEFSPVGSRIKRILRHEETEIDPGDGCIDPVKFQSMYVADRYLHWVKLFLPELKKGSVVISDRERLSTFAFGPAYGMSVEEIASWHQLLPLPDLTIFIRVTPEISLKRVAGSIKHREYFDTKQNIEKVFLAYEEAVKLKEVGKIRVVDGEKSKEEVSKQIWEIFLENYR
jgi:dTMP kinase